jgi:uncharacterized protein
LSQSTNNNGFKDKFHRFASFNSLWVYFFLAFGFSWLIFIPLALQGFVSGIPASVHMLGAYGPLLSSILTTDLISGQAGLKELLSWVAHWRIGSIWLLVSLLSPVVLFLITVSFSALMFKDWSSLAHFGRFTELTGISGFTGWALWIITFGLGEEVGWRGFALPRLQKRYNARTSSLILGAIWTAWHIPAFCYNYSPSLLSVTAFTVSILSGSALLTWLYNSTSGSVFATILWHGSFNAVVACAERIIPAVLSGAVILTVINIAKRFGPESFSSHPKHIIDGDTHNLETIDPI